MVPYNVNNLNIKYNLYICNYDLLHSGTRFISVENCKTNYSLEYGVFGFPGQRNCLWHVAMHMEVYAQ